MNFSAANKPNLEYPGVNVPKTVILTLDSAFHNKKQVEPQKMMHISWSRNCVNAGFDYACLEAKQPKAKVVQAFYSGQVPRLGSVKNIVEAFIHGVQQEHRFQSSPPVNYNQDRDVRDAYLQSFKHWTKLPFDFRISFAETLIKEKCKEIQEIEVRNHETGEIWGNLEVRKILSDPFQTLTLYNHLIVGVATPLDLGVDVKEVHRKFSKWQKDSAVEEAA